VSSDKTDRLIAWNVDLLKRSLQQIVARRRTCGGEGKILSIDEEIIVPGEGGTVIDEVSEIIEMPAFDSKKAKKQEDPEAIDLPDKVIAQLRDYVTLLAKSYRGNVSQKSRVLHYKSSPLVHSRIAETCTK
jgi:hypothetical protein